MEHVGFDETARLEYESMEEREKWEDAKYKQGSDVVVWVRDGKGIKGMIVDTKRPSENERNYSLEVPGEEGIYNFSESKLDELNS